MKKKVFFSLKLQSILSQEDYGDGDRAIKNKTTKMKTMKNMRRKKSYILKIYTTSNFGQKSAFENI